MEVKKDFLVIAIYLFILVLILLSIKIACLFHYYSGNIPEYT